MALWKRNKRYWTRFVVNGVKFRKPLRSPGQSRATTNWKEAVQLERDVIEQARNGALTPKAGPSRLFAACDAYLAAKRATANRERTVAFDEERLAIVKDRIGDVLLSTITREMIEGFQAKRKLDGVSNRTVNMDVGTLRNVLKRYGHWPAAGPRHDVERERGNENRSRARQVSIFSSEDRENERNLRRKDAPERCRPMLEGVNQFLSCGKSLEPGNCVFLERVSDLVSELADVGPLVHIPPEIPMRGHHEADTGTDRPQRRGWPFGKFRPITPQTAQGC
jgi:hypothetical protein